MPSDEIRTTEPLGRAHSYSPTRSRMNDHPDSNKYQPAGDPNQMRTNEIEEYIPYDYDQQNSHSLANSMPPLRNHLKRASSYEPYSSNSNPWGTYWAGTGNTNKPERWHKQKSFLPTYSALGRNQNDYNKYSTTRYREQQNRQSKEKDDAIRFCGYGDHRVSGVCEPMPTYWSGGELVTDPRYLTKSLKPRRLFYSPIGDGVVAADGIELKRLPPDLTPKVSVIHQRYVEKGDPGSAGLKVYEKTWDEGNPRNDIDDGITSSYKPLNEPDDGNKRALDGPDTGRPTKFPLAGTDLRPISGFPKNEAKHPADFEGDPNKKAPALGDDDSNWSRPFGDDDNRSSRPDSGLSFGTDGLPRQGWTKTFIVNPRELINQYGTETLTTIFDLKDHTPKTVVSVKETLTGVKKEDEEIGKENYKKI